MIEYFERRSLKILNVNDIGEKGLDASKLEMQLLQLYHLEQKMLNSIYINQ